MDLYHIYMLHVHKLYFHLPVVSELPSLAQLDVSGNNIATISASLGNMKALKDLDVSCNLITVIPNGVCTVCH